MNGGHWNHLRFSLLERANYGGLIWKLLASIEQTLDLGICGEQCYRCAQRRVILALEAYFDEEGERIENALRILQNSEALCERCQRVDPLEAYWRG